MISNAALSTQQHSPPGQTIYIRGSGRRSVCSCWLLVTLVLLTLAGCTTVPATQAEANDNLYQELGGESGIGNIVGRFIYLLGDEPRVNRHFEATNLDRFYTNFSAQLCHISGGPCVYDGDTMRRAHGGMDISETEFNLLVDLMIKAMDGEQVAHTTQNRLLKLLAPMRADIIYR